MTDPMGRAMDLRAAVLPLVVSILVVVAPPDWTPRVATAILAGAAVVAGLTVLASRRRTGLQTLERQLLRWANGDLSSPVEGRSTETESLRQTLEEARVALKMQTEVMRQQRDELASHLNRTEERLRDPNAETRRNRIARVLDLRSSVQVGTESFPAAIVDLTTEGAVLALKCDCAARLIPGLPVMFEMKCAGRKVSPVRTIAVAPARGGMLDLAEWVFRFEPGLDARSLPPELASALELREAERVRPRMDHPLTATLICDLGALPAQVLDVSLTGVGLSVDLPEAQLGALGHEITVQLHMPTLGRVAVLSSVVRNVCAGDDGARLGLHYAPGAESSEVAKVGTWIRRAVKSAA